VMNGNTAQASSSSQVLVSLSLDGLDVVSRWCR
jgi:hypothetical protein